MHKWGGAAHMKDLHVSNSDGESGSTPLALAAADGTGTGSQRVVNCRAVPALPGRVRSYQRAPRALGPPGATR
jgi:hypothetical protein